MQGKLMIKSKVIQTKKTKSSAGKRRTKPERSNTPQRWSRRIRSLPPIPINVLKARRKIKKKYVNGNQETFTSTTSLDDVKSRNVCHKVNRERKETVFIDNIRSADKSDSVEVVRIVPVVVYVKNSTKPQNIVPDEIRMHINDNPTCQMMSQVMNSHIHKNVKQRFGLGGRNSQRIRTIGLRPRGQNMEQVAKRKCSSRKKVPLIH